MARCERNRRRRRRRRAFTTLAIAAAAGWVGVGAVAPAARAQSAYEPTAVEQYSLELINRARANGVAEVWRHRDLVWGDDPARVPNTFFPQPTLPRLGEGIMGSRLIETVAPLAFDLSLMRSARDYTNALLANNAYERDYGFVTPPERMTAAGYPLGSKSEWGESRAITLGAAAQLTQATAAQQHAALFVDNNTLLRANRANVMNAAFRHVGVGLGRDDSYTYPGTGTPRAAVIGTYDFAYAGTAAGYAFTGVAFSDAVADDNFYDVGEGLGGVTVTATPVAGGAAVSTTTWAGGGYTLPVPGAGSYDVTFSGGGLAAPVTYPNVFVPAANVKLDASNDLGVWAGADGGAWESAANWTGGVPGGAGTVAHVGARTSGLTTPATVTLNADRTLGRLRVRGAGYTVAAANAGRLTFAGANAGIDASPPATIAAPIHLADPIDVTGSVTLSGPITGAPGKGITSSASSLVLSADNSGFDGGVWVVDGDVRVRHSRALGTGPLTLGFGDEQADLHLPVAGVNVANAIRFGPGGGAVHTTTGVGGTVELSGPIAVGRFVSFYTTAAAPPVFPNPATPADTLRLTGGLSDAAGATPESVIFRGGIVELGGVNTHRGRTVVGAPATTLILSGSIANSAELRVTDGKARLAADQDLRGLHVSTPSTGNQELDLNGHEIRLFAADLPAAAATLRAQIARTGKDGVYDSTATADMAVAYAVNADHILIGKALVGDATMDGAVDFDDLLSLAQHYGQASGRGWDDGDFTYDGAVNFDDLLKLAQHYNTTAAGAGVPAAPATFEADLAAAMAQAPEPGTAGLAGSIAAWSLMRRRRRTALH